MLKGVQAATTTVTKMNKIHTQKQQQQKHFTAREICVERNSVRYIPVNVCIKQVNKYENNYKRVAWQLDFLYVCESDRREGVHGGGGNVTYRYQVNKLFTVAIWQHLLQLQERARER